MNTWKYARQLPDVHGVHTNEAVAINLKDCGMPHSAEMAQTFEYR